MTRDFVEDPNSDRNLTEEQKKQLRETASGGHHGKWQERMKAGFNEHRSKGDKRNVRLPSPDADGAAMRLYGEREHATIELNSFAVSKANMQTDAAAFEGWALALRRWAGAEKVTLRWTDPRADGAGPLAPHYERFVYRAARFAQLFPEWFTLEGDVSSSRALRSDGRRVLNVAGDRSRLKTITPCHRGQWASEHEMECFFRQDAELAQHFGFGPGYLTDQQLPIGLFASERPSGLAEDRIFPGGKGAIDLVIAEGDRFAMFELKSGSNMKVGSISELIFYASVVRDAITGHFSFAPENGYRSDVGPEHLLAAKSVIAVLLGDDLHPLVDDPGIWQDLNRAVATHWKGDGKPTLEFRAAKVTDHGFKDVAPWR